MPSARTRSRAAVPRFFEAPRNARAAARRFFSAFRAAWAAVPLACLVLGVSFLALPEPVPAHHAFAAEFDATKPVRLRGKVTKVEWVNPHAWIHIDVTDEDGTVTPWMVECGPPGALVRRGWKKNSVAPGTEVLVEGYQAIDGAPRANGRDVTLPDGRRLFAGSSGTGAPYDDRESGG